MAVWAVAIKVLIKWGPVVFAAGKKALPYLKDNPAAQRFVGSMAEQTAALPQKLSTERRVKGKISAVEISLAEAAAVGVDPVAYARWREDLDEMSRTVVLARAAGRPQRRLLLKRCERRLDALVAEILPQLTRRRSQPPPHLPPYVPPAR
ncbi:MAG: hypothetical protein LH645_00590 [Actinomycetia bacterium]|nr:hypothetical protein [Actinomycetes bacterium]